MIDFWLVKNLWDRGRCFFPWHDGHESQSLMSHPDSLIETAGARARAQLEVYLRWWSMNKNSWRFATRPAVNFDLQKDAQKCLIIRGWLFDDRIARLIFFPGLQLFVFFWGGGVVTRFFRTEPSPHRWPVGGPIAIRIGIPGMSTPSPRLVGLCPVDALGFTRKYMKIPLSNWCYPYVTRPGYDC